LFFALNYRIRMLFLKFLLKVADLSSGGLRAAFVTYVPN
jgi:hypothetical protein